MTSSSNDKRLHALKENGRERGEKLTSERGTACVRGILERMSCNRTRETLIDDFGQMLEVLHDRSVELATAPVNKLLRSAGIDADLLYHMAQRTLDHKIGRVVLVAPRLIMKQGLE
jgi:hypothetical protein